MKIEVVVEQLIEVSHANGAWFIHAWGCLEPVLFRSGGEAETVALRLACCLAQAGCDARIEVRDKHNTVVGAHCYFAALSGSFDEDEPVSAAPSAPWRRRAVANSCERISAVS
jgi:hypothetical protein